MVETLVGMKLTGMRRLTKGLKASLLVWQIMFAITVIILSLLIATVKDVTVAGQLVAILFAVWALGWVIGPIVYGVEDKMLRLDYFRSLPLDPKRFSTAFMIASTLGLTVPTTLFSFGALAIYGARLGGAELLASLPFIVLQLAAIVLLARVTATKLREYTKSQFSKLLSSALISLVLAFLATGWWALGPINSILTGGVPHAVATVFYALPSGWGVAALQALHEGNWLLAVGLGMALLGLVWALWRSWKRSFRRRLFQPSPHVVKRQHMATKGSWPSSPVLAVAKRELITSGRDYARSTFLYFAFFYSVFLCLFPISSGLWVLLPFAGTMFVLTAAGATANAYALDGSVLWQLLVTPNAVRSDVRGRQLAWLGIIAPVAIVLTIGLVLLSGITTWWPLALGLCAAALGIGAGTSILISTAYIVPMIEPHLRGEDAAENGIDWGQFMLTWLCGLVLLAPVAGIFLAGVFWDMAWVQWLTLPAGIALGFFVYWAFGRVAIRRLTRHGVDILQTLTKGEPSLGTQPVNTSPFAALSHRQKVAASIQATLAMVLLFPQGLVPLLFKLIDKEDVKVWFLALYMPENVQWLAIAMFVFAGAGLSYDFLRRYSK